MTDARRRAFHKHVDPGTSGDPRLHSPVFHRNFPPIRDALDPLLSGRSGPVLEIGAGSGQHATGFARAFPRLDWWPSDPVPEHRASIAAHLADTGLGARAPLDLDAAKEWARDPHLLALGPLTAVIAINVIHIAPIAVASDILSGAARALTPGGLLIFYGPFHEHGAPTGPGNAAFDHELRARDPAWGIRDAGDIATRAARRGLCHAQMRVMPVDNRLLILSKSR